MQELLTSLERDQIIRRLADKGVRSACPMCGRTEFQLADGYFSHSVLAEVTGDVIIGSGPKIPTIAIVCRNCGFMSQHALGVLGLLQQSAREGQPITGPN